MPAPRPKHSALPPSSKTLGGSPPQDRFLSDVLRGLMHFLRGVALSGGNVTLLIHGLVFEFAASTTDSDMDLYAQEMERTMAVGPAQDEKAQQAKPSRVMLPPFQFDSIQNSIVSSNGRQVLLPKRLAYVLREMLGPDPVNRKCRRCFLPYSDVSNSYKEGWIDDFHPGLPQADKDARLSFAKDKIAKNPARLAHEFSRQLREKLRANGIEEELVLLPDRVNKGYKLGTGWHPIKPLLDSAEASLIYSADPEEHRFPRTRKPSRGGEREGED